jgi:membrane associated rhomboid family serine protease
MYEITLLNSPGTLSLMVATIVISLVAFGNGNFWRFLALEPFRMTTTKQYHAIVTSGFVHGNVVHLLVNMMTLYFFGPSLEATVGGDIFLIIYLASLVSGSLFPYFKFRRSPEYVAIGASGAISGVVFSFCLFYPFAQLGLFFIIPMPAIVFAILYVVYSVFAMRSRQDNIGHEAHLAGALGGVAVTLIAEFPRVVENLKNL